MVLQSIALNMLVVLWFSSCVICHFKGLLHLWEMPLILVNSQETLWSWRGTTLCQRKTIHIAHKLYMKIGY